MLINIPDNIKKSNILIVEDDRINGIILKELFLQLGFIHVNIAENGLIALEKINHDVPDLIIMDVMMPVMDGVECCRKIRSDSDKNIATIPILFQTSLDDPEDKINFFQAGASDYISKPADLHELVARVVVHLERAMMFQEHIAVNLRMKNELEMARSSQYLLIPNQQYTKAIENSHHIKINAYYHTCSELGGDFWGMKILSTDELAIYMVDFSGHGVNAALNVFRMHTLMHTKDIARTSGDYLSKLSAMLHPMLPAGQFATMFYGIINNKLNKLFYASAACPSPIIFRKDGTHEILDSAGTLIGPSPESMYETRELDFNSGDSILLYSDALIETPDDSGKMLPLSELINLFSDSRLKTDQFDAMINKFKKDYLNQQIDDLTLCLAQKL